MMNNKNRKKPSNLQLEKLMREQVTLSGEVNELSRSLLIIKRTLRNKQKNLREVNTALVQKSLRGPFLSVVPSNNTKKIMQGIEDKKSNNVTMFICLSGARAY